MTHIPGQPALPPEGPLSDLEQVFISESPPGLWPENQDSNIGALRRVLVTPLQDAVEEINDIFNELFIATAVGYLSRWEFQYGLPRDPEGATLWYRRAFLSNRAKRSAFTRTRRRLLIEDFIRATFGQPIELTPPGHPLSPGGSPMYGETVNIATSYSIVEDVENFHYTVNIIPTVDIDQPFLERELAWITPAGITFTITRNP